jgi:outer membrane protein, heavy metal efflux system
MKKSHIGLWAAALVVAVPSGRAQTTTTDSGLDAISVLIGGAPSASPAGPALTLEDIERIALAENPDIHVAARKLAAIEAHVPVAGALEDPQAMYRAWSVPLNQPWNYNSAQNMFMLGQSFAGRGKRGLRTAIARSDVEQAEAELEAVRLRVRVDARKAFIDMLRAQDGLRIHDQHVGLAQQAIQAARIKYTVGKIPQVEILKAQITLTRLAEHMIRFEKDAEVARARLNTLLGRAPEAPLQVVGEYSASQPIPSMESLTEIALHARPDLKEAAVSEEKSRKEQTLAKKAYAPDFNIAAGYMLMPSGQDPRNNYMVEGSMSLPWLNRHKHDAEIRESALVSSQKSLELEAMKKAVLGQIEQARVEARAAQRLANVYQQQLRPQAESTLHAAVVAYENDQTSFLDLVDSQMTVVDADLASIDAVAEFNLRMADLELAVGAPIMVQEMAK